MQPSEFLYVAQQLLVDTEAGLRTSISRSYYSQFLALRDKLIAKGYSEPTDNQSVHAALRKELVSRGYRSVARKLDNLRVKRVDADYNLTKMIIRKDANMAYGLALEIEGLVRKL